MTIPGLVVIALAFAALRIGGHKSLTFQACAHLFEGGVIVAWAAIWYFARFRRDLLAIWLGLGLVELWCFIFLPR